MLTIVGKTYAKTNNEFVESLFSQKTCNGFYKIMFDGVLLSDMQNKPKIFIKIGHNAHNPFAVSASNNSGRMHYMHGLCDLDAAWTGLDVLSHKAKIDAYNAIQVQL